MRPQGGGGKGEWEDRGTIGPGDGVMRMISSGLLLVSREARGRGGAGLGYSLRVTSGRK